MSRVPRSCSHNNFTYSSSCKGLLMSLLYRECDGSSTRSCLMANEVNRATTPPELRKFRKSTYLEPGKRYQHHGVADDLENLRLEDKVFGIRTYNGNGTAGEVMSASKFSSEADRYNRIKNDQIYKSSWQEPLGSRMNRKVSLPEKFVEGGMPFGKQSNKNVNNAKDIIFPHTGDESNEGSELYRRSHGNYAPGEQKTRDYDWPIDPENAVFGMKAGTLAYNGASTNIAEALKGSSKLDNPLVSKKSVEDFRNTTDVLGMSRNLGQSSGDRPYDMVYGQSSAAILKSKRIHTAAEVIKGNYTLREQAPDIDLGKSIMPGFRNIATEDRVFGCPSIRTDLAATRLGRRSVSDAQNYGDDVPAKYLINPPPFSDLSIGPDAMKILRPKDKIFSVFSKIGYGHIDPIICEKVFYKASNGSELCSINAYRNTLNEYLDAVEIGREEEWMRSNGIDFSSSLNQ